MFKYFCVNIRGGIEGSFKTEESMIKRIKSENDLSGYSEKLADLFIEYFSRTPWRIAYDHKLFKDHLYYVATKMSQGLLLADISEKDEINGFILAYPARLRQEVSFFPEATLSLYCDFILPNDCLWEEFLEETKKLKFRNLMSLTVEGCDSSRFFEEKGFKKTEMEVIIPVTKMTEIGKRRQEQLFFLMKKVLPPQK